MAETHVIQKRFAQYRSVALPTEHGGWGFLLEPVLLALLLAPSAAGVLLALAGLAAFLARHPADIWLRDTLARKTFPRTVTALRFALAYGGLAAFLFVVAGLLARWAFWPALVVALPFAAYQLIADVRKQSRSLLAELAGATALAALAPIITLSVGWPIAASLGLMGLLTARNISSIIYVRARVRRVRGQAVSITPSLTVQWLGLLCIGLLIWRGGLPWSGLIAMLLLLARAHFYLLRPETATQAKTIGFHEMAVGIVVVLIAYLGYMAWRL